MDVRKSKRKPDGCRTVRRVEEAVKRGRSTVEEFFLIAFVFAKKTRKEPVDFDLKDEVERFHLLSSRNVVAIPRGYKIPEPVLSFTDAVIANRQPEVLLRGLRKLTQPSRALFL